MVVAFLVHVAISFNIIMTVQLCLATSLPQSIRMTNFAYMLHLNSWLRISVALFKFELIFMCFSVAQLVHSEVIFKYTIPQCGCVYFGFCSSPFHWFVALLCRPIPIP